MVTGVGKLSEVAHSVLTTPIANQTEGEALPMNFVPQSMATGPTPQKPIPYKPPPSHVHLNTHRHRRGPTLLKSRALVRSSQQV